MSDFDDLPLIQCLPLPVPVGHPEHPEFRGYDTADTAAATGSTGTGTDTPARKGPNE